MAKVPLYIDNNLIEESGGSSYSINSSSASFGSFEYTYTGTGQFLGFSFTENSSTPESILSVGNSGTINDIMNLWVTLPSIYSDPHLYTVEGILPPSYSAADPLVIRYKGQIIYSTSSTSPITLAVSGKYLEDDITVTLNPPFAEQDSNTLNIYGAYTASKSGTILTLT